MFELKNILQIFLLPSVFLFLFFLIGFFLLLLKKKKIGKFFIFLGFFSYYLFSLSIVSDFILSPLEKEYTVLKEVDIKKANQIVLLLGGRESDILRGSEALRISHISGNEINIIISGTDPLNPRSQEATAVRSFFINRGVPEENIIIEGKSKNTWENVRNTKELLNNEPFFLVTSAYHISRAIKEFQRFDIDPIPAPTDFKVKGEYNIFDIFPDPQNLKKSDLAIKEHLGKIYYKLLFFFELQEENYE